MAIVSRIINTFSKVIYCKRKPKEDIKEFTSRLWGLAADHLMHANASSPRIQPPAAPFISRQISRPSLPAMYSYNNQKTYPSTPTHPQLLDPATCLPPNQGPQYIISHARLTSYVISSKITGHAEIYNSSIYEPTSKHKSRPSVDFKALLNEHGFMHRLQLQDSQKCIYNPPLDR
jgi:hypothetical protein